MFENEAKAPPPHRESVITHSTGEGALSGVRLGAGCGAAVVAINAVLGLGATLASGDLARSPSPSGVLFWIGYVLLYAVMAAIAGGVVGLAFGLLLGVLIGMLVASSASSPAHIVAIRATALGLAVGIAPIPLLLTLIHSPAVLLLLVFAPVFAWASYRHGYALASFSARPSGDQVAADSE